MNGDAWHPNVVRLSSRDGESPESAEAMSKDIYEFPAWFRVPESFELAAGMPEHDDSRWVVIAYDMVMAALGPNPDDDAPDEGMVISRDELEQKLARKDDLALPRFRRRMAEIRRTAMEKPEGVRGASRTTGETWDGAEIGADEVTEPGNPYRILSAKTNSGMPKSVFRALVEHEAFHRCLEEMFEDADDVLDDLENGVLAIILDRKARTIAVGNYEDVCIFSELSVAKAPRSGSLDSMLKPIADSLDRIGKDAERIRERMSELLLDVMRLEMNRLDPASEQKTGNQPANVVEFRPKR